MIHIAWITFKNEWKKLLRNRKMLISVFVMPVLMVFFMVMMFTTIDEKTADAKIQIYTTDRVLVQLLTEKYREDLAFPDEVPEHFEDGKIHIVVDGQLTVYMDSTGVSNRAGVVLNRVLNEIRTYRGGMEIYETFVSNRPSLNPMETGTDEDRIEGLYEMKIALIAMIAAMMCGTMVAYFAADIVAGEKERGVFDSIRLCGASMQEWYVGKEMVTVVITLLVYLLEGLAGLATVKVFDPSHMEDFVNAFFRLKALGAVLVLFASYAVLISGVFSMIAVFFDNTKQATSYLSIGMIFTAMPVALPLLFDNKLLEGIPFANFTPIMMHLLKGESVLTGVAATLIISLAVMVICSMVSFGTLRIKDK